MGESQDVIIKPFVKSSKSFKTVPHGNSQTRGPGPKSVPGGSSPLNIGTYENLKVISESPQ